ncbi:hypothetical protein BDV96DRAFT_655714 [Lophiotrema nucula]|uniref:Uncharacterized protein n=1 Tax=Lophiotrema nucula TaxID=690887 RepID=A0A6A5YEP3_9PLEO|nr:hypothetical protein BDV96DRAFT_655714 [Lophiotrema nucula]
MSSSADPPTARPEMDPPTKPHIKQFAGTCMVDGCLDPRGEPRTQQAGTFCVGHKAMHIFFMEELDPAINQVALRKEQEDKVTRRLFDKGDPQFSCISELKAFNGQPWREALKKLVLASKKDIRCEPPSQQYKLCRARCRPHLKTIDPEGLIFSSHGRMKFPCVLDQPPQGSEDEDWRKAFEPSPTCRKITSRMYSMCSACCKYWKKQDIHAFGRNCMDEGDIKTWFGRDQIIGSVPKPPVPKGADTDFSDSDAEAPAASSAT